MDGPPSFRILCARFSFLYFKKRAGSPLFNDGWVMCLNLTFEIYPPLQCSSCLHSDLVTLIFLGILNEIYRSEMLLKLYRPSIIRSMLCCLRCIAFDHLIFLNLYSICLSVTNFLYSCHLHCCTSHQ
jgi:hypothetical protein